MAPTSKDFDKAKALLQSVAWQMGGKVYMERLDDIRDALATVDANEAATEAREKKSGRKYKKLTEEQLAFKLEISPVELSRLHKIIKFPRLQPFLDKWPMDHTEGMDRNKMTGLERSHHKLLKSAPTVKKLPKLLGAGAPPAPPAAAAAANNAVATNAAGYIKARRVGDGPTAKRQLDPRLHIEDVREHTPLKADHLGKGINTLLADRLRDFKGDGNKWVSERLSPGSRLLLLLEKLEIMGVLRMAAVEIGNKSELPIILGYAIRAILERSGSAAALVEEALDIYANYPHIFADLKDNLRSYFCLGSAARARGRDIHVIGTVDLRGGGVILDKRLRRKKKLDPHVLYEYVLTADLQAFWEDAEAWGATWADGGKEEPKAGGAKKRKAPTGGAEGAPKRGRGRPRKSE